VKETLQQLIQLQRTDDGIVAMARRIEELDSQLDGARAALDVAKQHVDAAHHTRQEAQAATHRLEMDLESAEQEILKLEGQLNTASSNKEYQAIQLKIAHIKAENGKVEEKILLSMDDVEEKERIEDAAKAAQREAEAELRAAEGKVEEQRQGFADELTAMKTGRDELAGQVIPEKLKLYERIRGGNRKSGTAVVAVHGEYCQGCQMAVRPQDVTALVKGDEIVLCRTCQRILVLEE
jgi:predicted  nucleic acid-binding Zn-ribbon protein